MLALKSQDFGLKTKGGIIILILSFLLLPISPSISIAQQATIRAEVTIEGEVNKSGIYLNSQNQRIKDLILEAKDLTSEVYMLQVTLYRTDPVTGEVTTLTFDVAKAMQGNPEDNLVLKEFDRVVIYNDEAAAGMGAAGAAAAEGISKKKLVIAAIAAAVGIIVASDDDDVQPTTEHP